MLPPLLLLLLRGGSIPPATNPATLRTPLHEDGARACLANACPAYCSTPAEECVLRGHWQDGGPVSRSLVVSLLLCMCAAACQAKLGRMRAAYACAPTVHPPAPSVLS